MSDDVHVARDYRAESGYVFVEDTDDYWRYVPIEQAPAGAIITCARCGKPATRLDCFWPYYTSRNACAEHLVIEQQEEHERKAKKAAQARRRRARQTDAETL